METIVSRLSTFVEYLGVSRSSFERSVGMSNGSLGKALKSGGSLGSEQLAEVLRVYPQLNVEWLMLGTGEMIIGAVKVTIKEATSDSVRIMPIVIDEEDKEYITMVSEHAMAGYSSSFSDLNFVGEMPRFRIPMLDEEDGTYRCFPIKGDSMESRIRTGDYVIGRYVDELSRLMSGKLYIVVTRADGIMLKRIENRLDDLRCLILYSDNPMYRPFSLSPELVFELWEVKTFFSFAVDVSKNSEEHKEQRRRLDEYIKTLS